MELVLLWEGLFVPDKLIYNKHALKFSSPIFDICDNLLPKKKSLLF